MSRGVRKSTPAALYRYSRHVDNFEILQMQVFHENKISQHAYDLHRKKYDHKQNKFKT